MASGTYHFGGWGTQENAGGDGGQNTLPTGSILQARYEIGKVLGMGGMGAVYLAQDLRFTGVVRHCAVKEMIITTPDPQTRRLAMQSFNREANLLVSLSHPGIPKIYDFFSEANRSYLVMEYVDGQNLETTLENSSDMLDEKTVLDWGVQICSVLEFLHSQKPPIIFRDLKPANIMLRDQNRIALIDFGIAKAFESGQRGTMIGTEGYSPPEQYQGVASPRVDIYAIGGTLHHLLTKRDPRLHPPFSFQEAPPSTINPNLTVETNAIIMKATDYKPENRFQSATELKEALSAVLDQLSANSGGTMATKVLPDAGQMPPAQAAPPPPQQQATAYPPNYPPQGYPQYPPPGYPQYPPAGYQVPPGYGMPAPPTGAASPAEETVTPIWTFKCEDEVRASPATDGKALYIGSYDNNLYALDLKTGSFLWKYATDAGVATRPHIGNGRLVFGSEDRILYAISNRGRLMWSAPTQGRIRSSAIVEFERAFFGSDDGKVYAVNAQNGQLVWDYDAIDAVRSSPVIAGELLCIGTEGGTVLALEIRTGNLKWQARAKRAVTSTPAYYEKRDILIACSFDKAIYGFNAKNGYELWQIRTKQAVISSPTIYDDVLYVGGVDNHLYAINPSSGKTIWKLDVKAKIVSTPAVTDAAIYIGTTEGDVLCIGRQDRKIQWRFKTEGPVPSSPLVLDDVVYVGSADCNVYALPASV